YQQAFRDEAVPYSLFFCIERIDHAAGYYLGRILHQDKDTGYYRSDNPTILALARHSKSLTSSRWASCEGSGNVTFPLTKEAYTRPSGNRISPDARSANTPPARSGVPTKNGGLNRLTTRDSGRSTKGSNIRMNREGLPVSEVPPVRPGLYAI